MIVVTAGSAYMDIDSYAGCIAYAELLNLQGKQAVAASTAPLNSSITPSVQMSGINLEEYSPSATDEFVLIDISAADYIDPIVALDRVIEVIDHHPGHEAYWTEKLGDKAQIELVGSACTQVYERWKAGSKLELMRPEVASMLAAGILDNTLNFNANITNERDHAAYIDLARVGAFGNDFAINYFSECQKLIENDLENAIRNDTKLLDETENIPRCFGQLAVWEGNMIAHKDKDRIATVMQTFGEDWGVNIISIFEGKSYFLADNTASQNKFTNLFGVKFMDGISDAYPMQLRKEILRAAIDASKS